MNIGYYDSIVGKLTIVTSCNKLIGLYMENQKKDFKKTKEEVLLEEDDTIIKTKKWLDDYFDRKKPSIESLDIKLCGSDFQMIIWGILKTIPFGKSITYGEIAKKVCEKLHVKQMSPQAVGNAVGKNPIGIIIPCHRVLGTNGRITGYAGGINNKIKLLDLENIYYTK